MTRDVHAALAQHATDYTVRRELHRVPPHAIYEIAFGGRRAVCKLATDPEGDPATEDRIVEFVGRETHVSVPEVLAVGSDHFVAAYHEGVPEPTDGEDEAKLEAWARAAGAGMATLHAETKAAFEHTGIFCADDDGLALRSRNSWAKTVETLLDSRREFLLGTGYADVATAMLAFVRDHLEAFMAPDVPVLCHGNWLPAHVGTANGEVSCVIDFEHALFGPAEYDYWRTVLPTFAVRERHDLERAFRDGYESVRSLPDGFDRRAECYRALNTVSYLHSLFLQDRHDESGTERQAASMRSYVSEALGELRETFE
ncbi:aminoglycoside phosphotransferase family protein [Halobacteriales archaeon QS_3_64_16]|nr:MAG: aminoglycoside phosphotransferase family protein [Halobacteriales archaeon QS_3_64_16]